MKNEVTTITIIIIIIKPIRRVHTAKISDTGIEYELCQYLFCFNYDRI